ncbi:hypothetical protein A9Q84_17825 [Halobacteriovorax marinus]|uniref:Uncharacterized protein n=1 Tax=Halobacteriovorax marinus TaxID=97084 RepID=A0A1Y5F3S7_9BACT|nr:hypothetical protein A9Q84_17825 [Halobacteriovorax marinus]
MSLTSRQSRALKILALITLSLDSGASLHFICENTQVNNGVIDSYSSGQFISINSPHEFNNFRVYNLKKQSQYKKGLWQWTNKGKSFAVNLTKVMKGLPFKNLSVKLRYSTSESLAELKFSPILIKQKSHQSSFPKASIETLNPNLAIHQTWQLPKRVKAITSANFYIEYSEKYSMLTRVIQKLQSAFIKNTISCKRILKDPPFKQAIGKSSDLTNLPHLWPENLGPLKNSIQQLLIDGFLEEKIDLATLKNHAAYFLGVDLSKRLIQTHLKLERFTTSKFDLLFKQLRDTFANGLSNIANGRVKRIFSNERRQGKMLLDQTIDKSELAYDKLAYIPNEYINLDKISRVALYKKEENFYLYFFGNKSPSQIEVGPFKMQNLYWKVFQKNPGLCTKKTMRHLNEYERKSFVFKRAKILPVDEELIFFERKNKRYPLNEMIITNNCRGPGNFEFEWPGIVKGYFQIPRSIMDQWYQEYNKSNDTFDSLFVENRISKFYEEPFSKVATSRTLKDKVVSLWSKYFEKEYRWFSNNDFDSLINNCSITDINKDLLKETGAFTKTKITYDLGKIEYDQFPVETRLKSGYNRIKTPLIYVKTPCNDTEASVEAPKHFYPPKPFYDQNSLSYWKKKTCKIVPMNFFYYKDLLKYQVHLSKFEVDGVYVGQNREDNPRETTDYDQSLLTNTNFREAYDFKNAYAFKEAFISKSRDGKRINIKLTSKENLNLILANIDLSKLIEVSKSAEFKSKFRPWATDKVKGIYKLIGIKPFDLSSSYQDSNSDSLETYALFYDQDGTVVNHHRKDVGIEQWFLRYRKGKLILDLISHERITPVARIEINYLLD